MKCVPPRLIGDSGNFAKHKAIHEEHKHHCPVCKKSFSRKQHLDRHGPACARRIAKSRTAEQIKIDRKDKVMTKGRGVVKRTGRFDITHYWEVIFIFKH